MIRDGNGILWINCLEGLFLYDEEADSALFPISKLRIGSDISAQKFARLKDGQILIGGNGEGFYICSPRDTPFEYFANGGRRAGSENLENYIPMLRLGPSNEIVFLFRDLMKLNERTSTFEDFATLVKPFRDDSDRYSVKDYFSDLKGREWVATQSGVILKDEHGRVRFFDRGKETGYGIDGGVKLFHETADGRIIAFASSYALYYDEVSSEFEAVRFCKDSITRWMNSATCVFKARDGTLFMGSLFGLHRLYPDGTYGKSMFPDYQITDIHGTDEGGLYMTIRGSGLLYYFPENDQVISHGVEEGLTNTTVYSLEEDPLGYLWMSTNRGLFRFNPTKQTFFELFLRNGNPREQVQHAVFRKTEE